MTQRNTLVCVRLGYCAVFIVDLESICLTWTKRALLLDAGCIHHRVSLQPLIVLGVTKSACEIALSFSAASVLVSIQLPTLHHLGSPSAVRKGVKTGSKRGQR